MEIHVPGNDNIGIINYEMGNLRSVQNALHYIGLSHIEIISDPEKLSWANRIILPGVGAFEAAMAQLKKIGMVEALTYHVVHLRKPFLGICLGMQLIAKTSREGGLHEGLGWIDADVLPLSEDTDMRVPHIGWNDVTRERQSSILDGVDDLCDFYFVHGFHVKCHDPELPLLTCDYGCSVTAAVLKNNIFATQFHPEKSQRNGLKLLENFAAWRPDLA